jgi:SAM-dependent methyltransferase
MANRGPDFYDQEEVFSWYRAKRARPGNANDTLEKPVFDELAAEIRDLRILDLGCGDGGFGLEALQKGARSYTGVEASRNMFQVAVKNLAGTPGKVVQAAIEDWDYPAQAFDLVTSRMALHYIEALPPVFSNVLAALAPAGRFLFSVEHPVITSCDRSSAVPGVRQDWIVDDYFDTGRRVVSWMGDRVVKYHRTVEDYFGALREAGFQVEQVRESRPRREVIGDEETYRRRLRIPLMLFFAARRAEDKGS